MSEGVLDEPRIVDLRGVDDRKSLHERLAQDLGFPEYYGHNWDAFLDCVTDLAASEPGASVLFRGYGELKTVLPKEARLLKECLGGLREHGLQVLWE